MQRGEAPVPAPGHQASRPGRKLNTHYSSPASAQPLGKGLHRQVGNPWLQALLFWTPPRTPSPSGPQGLSSLNFTFHVSFFKIYFY